MTQRQKLVKLFQSGVALTEKQITQRTGAQSPRALIHTLRHKDGLVIEASRRVDNSGRATTKYSMVAAKRRAAKTARRAKSA